MKTNVISMTREEYSKIKRKDLYKPSEKEVREFKFLAGSYLQYLGLKVKLTKGKK